MNDFKAEVMKATHNLDNGGDDIKIALLTDSHTTNVDTQHDWADVSANEVSGSGYSAGGKSLTSLAVTVDDTDDEGVFDAANISWTSSTITARYAVIYNDSASNDELIAIIDFGENKTSTNGTFEIQWAAEGIVNIG